MSSLVDGEDLAELVIEATGGAAIRLGIDAVGGTATGRLADCLCESAMLVNYGRMSDDPCTVQPDAFIFRNLTLRGFWLVNWFRHTPEEQRAVLLGEIAGLIAKGKLHAPIHATYDVSEIKEAVACAASGDDPERSSSSRDGELTPERSLTSSQSCLLCPREHECGSRPLPSRRTRSSSGPGPPGNRCVPGILSRHAGPGAPCAPREKRADGHHELTAGFTKDGSVCAASPDPKSP